MPTLTNRMKSPASVIESGARPGLPPAGGAWAEGASRASRERLAATTASIPAAPSAKAPRQVRKRPA